VNGEALRALGWTTKHNGEIMRYGKIYSEIMARVDLSPRAKVVAAALDMMRNPISGQCNPKMDKLAEVTGTSKTSLRRALVELIEAGLIERHKTGKIEQSFVLFWGLLKAEKNETTGGIDETTGGFNETTGGIDETTGGFNKPRAAQPYIMNEKEKKKKKEKENEKEDELSFADMVLKEAARIGAEMEKN
jgi:hypothetical protein